MWCTITPHHVLYTWCWKGILVHDARITNGNPKFDLLHDYFMLQTKLAVHGEKSYGTPWLCTHPCPKFEVIWIMLGELMANKYQIGFERHDRLTSYLNYDSGLLIDKDCLFTFIIFHGQYLTHIWHKWRLACNLELVMKYGRSGQTTVDQSFWSESRKGHRGEMLQHN